MRKLKYIIKVGTLCLSLFAISLLLTGCNSKQDAKSSKGSISYKAPKKQVRFIGQWLNEGKKETLIHDFIRAYEFENQDVDIVLEFPENIFLNGNDALVNEQFVTNILEEENPQWDIIRIINQYDEVAALTGDPLWAKKHLVDFSVYPQFRENTMPSLVSEEAKAYWKGMIPGPYLEGQYHALWSNQSVAKKIGIEVRQTDMTIDDFKSYIRAVHDYNKRTSNKIVPIYEGSDWNTFYPFAFHLYASAVNNPELLYTTDINSQKLEAWYQVLQVFEEISAFNIAENWQKKSWLECGKELLKGNALFYINGSWMYNIWESDDKELVTNCYPNELPVFNPMDQYPGGYIAMWGVLKNAPNRDEAVDFLLAMTTPEIGDLWVQYTKTPTGIKTSLSDATISSDQFESFAHHIQSTYGNNMYQIGTFLDRHIVGADLGSPTFHNEVITGEMTANEAYTRIKTNLGL